MHQVHIIDLKIIVLGNKNIAMPKEIENQTAKNSIPAISFVSLISLFNILL